MISEVDIRDWDRIISSAKVALDDMDDYARMSVGVDAFGPRKNLEMFIQEVEHLIKGQQKQVAALFKPKDGAYDTNPLRIPLFPKE